MLKLSNINFSLGVIYCVMSSYHSAAKDKMFFLPMSLTMHTLYRKKCFF